jgi:hypothetical protein
MTSPFKTIAGKLSRAGFHVLPIKAEDKRPGEYRNAKWFNAGNWQRHRDTKPTDADLAVWQQWPDANIGIVLGSDAGDGTTIIAVDIDTEDPDETEDLIRSLPFSPMAKTGAKGITLFYRAGSWIRSKGYRSGKRALGDLLTGNATKQTVVPPSMHPDGMAYKWVRGPVDKVAELPELTEDHLTEFEEMMEALGWNDEEVVAATPEQIEDDPFGDVKVVALQRLEDWVPDLNLFRLSRSADGFRAVPTWRASGSGRADKDRARSLSITRRGIRDHGAGKGYSPIDLVMAALNLEAGSAFSWLEKALGMEQESAEVIQITSRKKRNPDVAPEDDFEAEDEVFYSYQDNVPTYGLFVEDDAIQNWRQYPPCDPITAIAEWIERGSATPLRSFAIGAAITAYGAAIARQFVTCYKTPGAVNTFMIGLAPSGAGKDHSLKMVERLLIDAGLDQYVGPPQWTSASVLDQRLVRHPIAISPIDEAGDFMLRMMNSRSSPAEMTKERGLKTLYSSGNGHYMTQEMAAKASERIHAPFLSIFGVATPEGFYEALPTRAIEGGLFNRFLILNEHISEEELARQKTDADLMEATFGERPQVDVPPSIVALLRNASTCRDGVAENVQFQPSVTAQSGSLDPGPTVVDGPNDVKLFWSRYREHTTTATRKDAQLANMYARAAENALRIATVLSVAECNHRGDPWTLQPACMEWACRFVDWSTRTNIRQARGNLFASKQAALQDRIRLYIKDRDTVKRRQLVNNFRKQIDSLRDLDSALALLCEGGYLHRYEKENKSGVNTVFYRYIGKA